jgi:hypothetical protein
VITLRIFHPGRHVWRISRKEEANSLSEKWLSLRRVPPDWNLIFRRTLDLIWLANISHSGGIDLAGQHGSITWQERKYSTKLEVCIQGFSPQKRALVAATLLKAARFNEIEEE